MNGFGICFGIGVYGLANRLDVEATGKKGLQDDHHSFWLKQLGEWWGHLLRWGLITPLGHWWYI